MSKSSEMYREEAERDFLNDPDFQQEQEQPGQIMITPGILTLSKTNAEQFHQQMRQMILNTGYGAFEYLETINFFVKLKDYIIGNKQAKIPEDVQLRSFVREEIAKHPKGKLTTARGVIFEMAETGTTYDFSLCNDPLLTELEAQLAEITEKVKSRREFLKTLPIEGLSVIDKETGEVSTIYAPSKSSNSSYKVSLPK